MKLLYTVILSIVFVSCVDKNNDKTTVTIEDSEAQLNYHEPYRNQFHFSPAQKWMNDPNGLVYHNGVYHLFYQYYPDDIVWGPMHWGHAVSKDLVRWEHKPIALFPDKHGLIFSGSAVVDSENTSGFGTKENPPLVAIFTYHLMAGEKAGRTDFQTQGIAYSLDNGDTWTKYEGNPVIGNDGIKDFRDPKVFWHAETEQWVMALVAGDHVKLYHSKDLKNWQLASEFGRTPGAHGGVWECPDLFPLKVTGEDEEKWVMLVSINPGAPNGGSGTQYFVGDFDGTTFTPTQAHDWIDYGRDNYAGVTYNNTPNGERVFIGWMSNWQYARDTPTEVWRSSMTLPRGLSLHKESEGYILKNYPVASIKSLRSESSNSPEVSNDGQLSFEDNELQQSDITFEANLSQALTVRYQNKVGEDVSIVFDPLQKEITFDRKNSGETKFSEEFAPSIQKQSYIPKNELVEIRILMDASSIEVYVDKGRNVFTNQLFPSEPYNELKIQGEASSTIENFTSHNLTSIWNHHE